MLRRRLKVAMWVAPLAVILAGTSLMVSGQTGAKNGEWPHWGADLGNTKYSALDQINRDTVKNLRVAWRWKADNFGPRPQNNLEATPLMVGGVLYTTAGTRPSVAAIDGATGETLWTYRLDEGARGDMAPRSVSRGVEYWTDGKQQRIILITRGYRMVSLDAKTGLPDPSFGRAGVIDLYEDFDQPTPKDGTISSTSPAVVVNNVIVVGAALQAGTAPRSKENTKGYVRGYDVRSGKRIWTFHTIPHPGEFGNDTWLNDSWAYTGNTAVWSPFSADEELGYVYLPVESPTGDFYGGHRPGNNLFAGSLVCLDAKTGKRVWHQQLVHHDIWDYDIASPPNLINITVNGKPIRAVAQVTKQSYRLRVRSCDGRAGLADRGAQGSGRRHAGRMVFADAAASDQACAVRSSGCAGKRSDRFHARAERAGSRNLQPVPKRPAVYAAERADRYGSRHAAASRQSGIGPVAGRGVGSRDEHALRAVGVEHDSAGAAARRHPLGHDLHRWRWRRWRTGSRRTRGWTGWSCAGGRRPCRGSRSASGRDERRTGWSRWSAECCRLQLRCLQLALAGEAVAAGDVVALQPGRPTSLRHLNSDAERSLLSAPARAAVHGVSGRRDCRSSSRPTGASRPTT